MVQLFSRYRFASREKSKRCPLIFRPWPFTGVRDLHERVSAGMHRRRRTTASLSAVVSTPDARLPYTCNVAGARIPRTTSRTNRTEKQTIPKREYKSLSAGNDNYSIRILRNTRGRAAAAVLLIYGPDRWRADTSVIISSKVYTRTCVAGNAPCLKIITRTVRATAIKYYTSRFPSLPPSGHGANNDLVEIFNETR